MQIIIDTTDTSITVRNKCFYIENKNTSRQISPKRVSSIAITSNVLLNAAAIKLAAREEVAILFFNNRAGIEARLWSPYFINTANLRKKQLLFSMSPLAGNWVIEILEKKIKAQIAHLHKLAWEKRGLKESVIRGIDKMEKNIIKMEGHRDKKLALTRHQLMGLEGRISREYFQSLNLFLPPLFKFAKRSRRPALDYFNASLNYIYGMTYSIVENGVFAKGLDPFIGFLHVDSFKSPTLVFDLIEPVRPLMDHVLLNLIMEKQLTPKHFIKKEEDYWLNKKGKRVIIHTFNNFLHERVTIDNSVKRVKDHIFEESNALGKLIEESITIE